MAAPDGVVIVRGLDGKLTYMQASVAAAAGLTPAAGTVPAAVAAAPAPQMPLASGGPGRGVGGSDAPSVTDPDYYAKIGAGYALPQAPMTGYGGTASAASAPGAHYAGGGAAGPAPGPSAGAYPAPAGGYGGYPAGPAPPFGAAPEGSTAGGATGYGLYPAGTAAGSYAGSLPTVAPGGPLPAGYAGTPAGAMYIPPVGAAAMTAQFPAAPGLAPGPAGYGPAPGGYPGAPGAPGAGYGYGPAPGMAPAPAAPAGPEAGMPPPGAGLPPGATPDPFAMSFMSFLAANKFTREAARNGMGGGAMSYVPVSTPTLLPLQMSGPAGPVISGGADVPASAPLGAGAGAGAMPGGGMAMPAVPTVMMAGRPLHPLALVMDLRWLLYAADSLLCELEMAQARGSSANVFAIQRFAQEIKACRSSAMEVQRQIGALKVANGVPLEEKDSYMRLYYPTTTVPVGTLSAWTALCVDTRKFELLAATCQFMTDFLRQLIPDSGMGGGALAPPSAFSLPPDLIILKKYTADLLHRLDSERPSLAPPKTGAAASRPGGGGEDCIIM